MKITHLRRMALKLYDSTDLQHEGLLFSAKTHFIVKGEFRIERSSCFFVERSKFKGEKRSLGCFDITAS